MDGAGGSWLVTLTYGKTWPADWHTWKRDLAALRKRLLRKYAGCSGLWVLEAQYRGAPHFHIILHTPGRHKRRALAEYIATSWCYIRGQQPGNYELQSVDIKSMETVPDAENGGKRLGAYLTAGGAPTDAGKCWDTFGGKK